jgi:hypothetical protein
MWVSAETPYIPIPAVCGTCGKIIPTPFGVPSTGTNMVIGFKNMNFLCPYCFGKAITPSEWMDLSRPDVMEALKAPTTEANFKRLISVLSAASKEDLGKLFDTTTRLTDRSADEVANEIEQTAPALAEVADWLRQNNTTIAVWLTLLVAVLAWLLPRSGPVTETHIINVTNSIVEICTGHSVQP